MSVACHGDAPKESVSVTIGTEQSTRSECAGEVAYEIFQSLAYLFALSILCNVATEPDECEFEDLFEDHKLYVSIQ